MKSYEEMIQWVVDNNSQLRYNEWPAVMAISESYNIPIGIVRNDVQFEKDLREKEAKERRKADRKAQNQASNEQRRLANLAKWREVNDE